MKLPEAAAVMMLAIVTGAACTVLPAAGMLPQGITAAGRALVLAAA